MALPGPLSVSRRSGIALALLVVGVLLLLVVSGVLSVSFQLMGPAGETPPQGSFHVTDGDSVMITRDVGPPVEATHLQIRVNGNPRGTWSDHANGSSTVEVGDSITVDDVDAGDAVSLYWTESNVSQKLVSKNV